MEENAVYERYLLPRLDSYREFLEKNGVKAEMSMDADEIPGLIVFTPEAENFYITFMEGDLEAPEVMRITAEHVEYGGERATDTSKLNGDAGDDDGAVIKSDAGAGTGAAVEMGSDAVASAVAAEEMESDTGASASVADVMGSDAGASAGVAQEMGSDALAGAAEKESDAEAGASASVADVMESEVGTGAVDEVEPDAGAGAGRGIEVSPEDIVYRSLLVATSEVKDVDTLLRFGRFALSDRCMVPYPTREMVEEISSDEDEMATEDYASAGDDETDDVADGAVDVDEAYDVESDEEANGDESDEALGLELGEISFDTGVALMPRISALMRSYIAGGIEDAEAVYAKVPYIISVDGDATFISAYEQIGDNDFLLHFRADVPFDEDEDIEELREQIRSFNEEHFFVRCALGFEDLGIYDEVSGNVITFFACTPDIGGIKDDAVYGFFAALFESEYMEFFE
jgi:hypothetical protein